MGLIELEELPTETRKGGIDTDDPFDALISYEVSALSGEPLSLIADSITEHSSFDLDNKPQVKEHFSIWRIRFNEDRYIGMVMIDEYGRFDYVIEETNDLDYIERYIDDILETVSVTLSIERKIRKRGVSNRVKFGYVLKSIIDSIRFKRVCFDGERKVPIDDGGIDSFNIRFKLAVNCIGLRFPARKVLRQPSLIINAIQGTSSETLEELFSMVSSSGRELSITIEFSGDGL